MLFITLVSWQPYAESASTSSQRTDGMRIAGSGLAQSVYAHMSLMDEYYGIRIFLFKHDRPGQQYSCV